MTAAPERPGLRERKKAGTRAAIRHHALRLFAEQGFDATSVEQIAEAAEVSDRTVFRYFPTKETLVTVDDYDELIAGSVDRQPAGIGPVTALREAFREVLGGLGGGELAAKRERQTLVLSVPSLWAASLPNVTGTRETLTGLVAGRLGKPKDDPRVRALAGAVFGVMLTVWFDWADDPALDAPAALDAALAELAKGFGEVA